MGFRADQRAAAVTLMEAYSAANDRALKQVYPGRPGSLYPPCGFVDSVNDSAITYTAGPRQRNTSVDIMLIKGLFDSEEAVTSQDELVDGFLDYVTANFHAAGASTLLTITAIVDLPAYQPDWIPDAPFYFASRVTLEGLKLEGGLV